MADQPGASDTELATSKRPNSDSPPVVETVVPASASARAHTPISAEKIGMGALIAWVVIPAVLVMLLAAAFWLIPMLKSTTEDGPTPHGRGPMGSSQSE